MVCTPALVCYDAHAIRRLRPGHPPIGGEAGAARGRWLRAWQSGRRTMAQGVAERQTHDGSGRGRAADAEVSGRRTMAQGVAERQTPRPPRPRRCRTARWGTRQRGARQAPWSASTWEPSSPRSAGRREASRRRLAPAAPLRSPQPASSATTHTLSPV